MEITLNGLPEMIGFAFITQAPYWFFIYARTIIRGRKQRAEHRKAQIFQLARDRAQGKQTAA